MCLRVQAVLAPGDVLLIPPFWFHHVTYHTGSAAISHAQWFKPAEALWKALGGDPEVVERQQEAEERKVEKREKKRRRKLERKKGKKRGKKKGSKLPKLRVGERRGGGSYEEYAEMLESMVDRWDEPKEVRIPRLPPGPPLGPLHTECAPDCHASPARFLTAR